MGYWGTITAAQVISIIIASLKRLNEVKFLNRNANMVTQINHKIHIKKLSSYRQIINMLETLST
jgi:hypothetical protein